MHAVAHPAAGAAHAAPISAHDASLESLRVHIFQLTVLFFLPLLAAWAYAWRSGRSRQGGAFMMALLGASWTACAVGMHTLNKALVMILDAPTAITVVQMGMAALAMLVFNFSTLVSAATSNGGQVRKWLIVPTVFAGMLVTSSFQYRYITLCEITLVRNCAPLIALPIEAAVMPASGRSGVSRDTLFSLLVMILGALVYAAAAPKISPIGVAFAVMNMVLAITDRMIQRRLLSHDCKELQLEVCTFLNNFFGLFPATAVALSTHEVQRSLAAHAGDWARPEVVFILLLSGLVGLGICYFGLASQRIISATSFLVMQNVSKILVVCVGVLVFGDPVTSGYVLSGLLLSLGGSCLYGLCQLSAKASEAGRETQPLLKQAPAGSLLPKAAKEDPAQSKV